MTGKPSLRLAGIHYRGDPDPAWPLAAYARLPIGADGIAVYALDGDPAWPDGLPMRQPFALRSTPIPSGCVPHHDGAWDGPDGKVWVWNGDRQAPSLTPSYAWNKDGPGHNPTWPYTHLYLTNGRIVEDGGEVEVQQ